jgi:hypothetical protein
VLTGTPSIALATLVLATALAIAAVNVMIAATIAFVASSRVDQIRAHLLVR